MITLRERQHGKRFCSLDPITMGAVMGGGGQLMQMGGTLFGGLFGSSAERKRAAAIREAGSVGASEILNAGKSANAQIDTQLGVARGDLSPFRGFGVDAGNSLMSLLIGGRSPSQFLQESDLFKFQSDLGSRNINRELASRGLYGSGAGLETLARFNNQLVGEEGQRMVDRLFNLTNLGAGSASTMGQMTNNAGMQQGQNIFNSGIEAANMRYNSTVGAANARAQANHMLAGMGQNLFGQAGQGLMQYGNFMANKPFMDQSLAMLQKMTGSGGGGGMTGGNNLLDPTMGR